MSALRTFVEMIARLQTDEDLGGDMSGDDAVAALNSLIYRARDLVAPPKPWTHTTEQLIADLRWACAAYYFRALTAEGSVRALEKGIAQAMTSLTSNPEPDVVWFDKTTTLWEFLAELRDPEDVLPVPPASVQDERIAHVYASLPRDPATGRPVIA